MTTQRLFTIPKSIRLLFGTALLLLVLGAGNIIYGSYKFEYYDNLYKHRHEWKAEYTILDQNPPFDSKIELPFEKDEGGNWTARETRNKKILARRDYYDFHILGGKCFLALSGALLLFSLLWMKWKEPLQKL